MNITFMCNMLLVATVIQLTKQEKVINILEEIAKNFGNLNFGDDKTEDDKIGQYKKVKSETPNTYKQTDMLQEKNQSSKTSSTSVQNRDKLILSNLISLMENYASQKNEQSNSIGEIKSEELNPFSKEYEEKVEEAAPLIYKKIEAFLHHRDLKEEDDNNQLTPTIPTHGIPWKKEMPEKPNWLPWIAKKQLDKSLWSGISTPEKIYNIRQKNLKNKVIERIIDDLNDLFLLDELT